jgi:hypothetical protein
LLLSATAGGVVKRETVRGPSADASARPVRAGADLDAVPVAEGIARLARVVAAGGSKYAAVIEH